MGTQQRRGDSQCVCDGIDKGDFYSNRKYDEMQAELIPCDGGDPISITRDVTVVGRKGRQCDMIIDRSSVSKLQCVIVKTDGLLFVRDLGSTNGTKVNGQRVTRGALLPGDELAFASVRFRIHLGPGSGEEEQDEQTEKFTLSDDAPDSNGDDFGDDLAESDSDVRLFPED